MTTETHPDGGNGLREQFLLDPAVRYFNHGSQGACPRSVFETYQVWQRTFERQPIAFGREHGGAIHAARQALADYVGSDVNNLVYVVNATMGINIVARSLPLQPGEQVLSTDHEYVRVSIPVPVTSAKEAVEAIWAGVTDRTRVIAVSHITSPTAWILPVRELARRARAAGIWTVIDGAHAPGQVPLVLDALGTLGVDFYTGNCHKWL